MFGFGKHKGKKKVEITVIEETVIVIDGQIWFHEHHPKHRQKVQLIDSDTQGQVLASFANAAFSGDNDAAFTVAPDSSDPNTVKVTGVAAGTGKVNVTADATYTDANTGQQVTKTVSASVDVTVTAVAAGENVELQVNFGAPQDQV